MAHGHNSPAPFGIRTRPHELILFRGTGDISVYNNDSVAREGDNRFRRATPAAWASYDLTEDSNEIRCRYDGPAAQEIIQSRKTSLGDIRREVGGRDFGFPEIGDIGQAIGDETS